MENKESYEEIAARWQSIKKESREDLRKALAYFTIPFAYHSGAIENPNISYENTREIFENNSVSQYTGSVTTLLEIQNQRTCHEFLLTALLDKEPITPGFICRVHERLLADTYNERLMNAGERPGSFKKDFFLVGNDIGADPEDVEEEMQILCGDLAGYEGPDFLKAGAFFHLQFESIHPFASGNGRSGRSLLNYYLMAHDLPPFIIFREDKDAYYQALYDFDNRNTLDTFVEFAVRETRKTWEGKYDLNQ
jgi:Fic family protein